MTSYRPPAVSRTEPIFSLPGIEARFDHVALAVPRIIDVLPLYQDLLGGSFFIGGDNPALGFRGVQLAHPGGKIELLEPLAGSTFLDRFFVKRPSGGLHHVTFTVGDLEAAVAAAQAAGFTVHGETGALDWWQEVFLDLSQTHGVLIQLAHAGPGYGAASFSLDDVLAGHGNNGNGQSSPGHGQMPTYEGTT